MTFKEWMELVDKALEAICGLSSLDLADQTFYDWFESEMSPKEAAQETLKNEGFYKFVYGS